jgi:hypothetical protein
MQRFFSFLLIILMSLSVVIPAAIPFYEIYHNQLTGALMEDMAGEEDLAEIEKETCAYGLLVFPGSVLEQESGVSPAFPRGCYPVSQFLPGLVDVPPEHS